jgi:hypothetical protein
MVQILRTYVYKWKNDIRWDYSKNWVREGWRRMVEGVNSVRCIISIIRDFVNATMYPQHNNKKKVLF